MLEKSAHPPAVVVTVWTVPADDVAVTGRLDTPLPFELCTATRIDPSLGLIAEAGTATVLVSDTIVDDGPDSHHNASDGSSDHVTQIVTFNIAPVSLAGDTH